MLHRSNRRKPFIFLGLAVVCVIVAVAGLTTFSEAGLQGRSSGEGFSALLSESSNSPPATMAGTMLTDWIDMDAPQENEGTSLFELTCNAWKRKNTRIIGFLFIAGFLFLSVKMFSWD